jgi:hypothetical protein
MLARTGERMPAQERDRLRVCSSGGGHKRSFPMPAPLLSENPWSDPPGIPTRSISRSPAHELRQQRGFVWFCFWVEAACGFSRFCAYSVFQTTGAPESRLGLFCEKREVKPRPNRSRTGS